MTSPSVPNHATPISRSSIAYVWISLAAFIAVLYVVLRVFVLSSFIELEEQNTLENVQRVLNAVGERTMALNAKASDWAAWDDAYQFVQDRNARFIRSNFVLSAFTGNNLNLIAYISNTGEIVYARWYQPGTDRLVLIPDDVRRAILRKGLLTSHRDVHGSVSGIVMLKRGPMLIASRPVVTSNEMGPIRGSLIFGQLLDLQEIQSLSRVTRVPTVIKRLDVGNLPADFAQAKKAISGSEHRLVKPLSRHMVAGYAVMDDIYGVPALMLRVELPRSIYERGLSLSNYTLLMLVLVSLLFGSIVSLLLVRTLNKEREFVTKTNSFYRRTITAATDGKLIITDPPEIYKLCGVPVAEWKINSPADMPEVRRRTLEITSSAGMEEQRAWNFATGMGEAVTNAIKHAGGGTASLCCMHDGLLFVMSDQGPGIPALTIPDVALRSGYSTAGTLGMGYKIMISLEDRVYLATGPQGTIVAIEMKLQPEESTVSETSYVGQSG